MMHQPPRDYVPVLPEPESDEKPVTVLIAALLVAAVSFAAVFIWILWGAK